MFYVSDTSYVYQTASRELAEALGSDVDEMGTSVMNIDFGGVVVTGMEYIHIQAGDAKYSLLAHHLKILIQKLQKALIESKSDHIVLHGYPFAYAIKRSDAVALDKAISKNWNEYYAQELHNLQRYDEAISSLSNYPGVDVRREVATIKQREVH